jgi:hypothetical protein
VQRSTQAKINLHQMPGSHSIDQLTSTFKARLSTTREAGKLNVRWKSPTRPRVIIADWFPLRQIVLDLRSSYGGKRSRRRVYRRAVADQSSKVIDREQLS